MFYDNELIAHKLLRWEKSLKGYRLPTWEELPTIDLYMEQIIALLGQWLYFLPAEDTDGAVVTPTAINNYVRLKIMPAPNKKKYSRIHMAYLIMICTLKQCLSISYVQKMIPYGLSEDEVKVVYGDFVEKHREAALFFVQEVGSKARPIFDNKEDAENAVDNLVTSFAVFAGFSKLMTEKIITLQDADMETILAEEEAENRKTDKPSE